MHFRSASAATRALGAQIADYVPARSVRAVGAAAARLTSRNIALPRGGEMIPVGELFDSLSKRSHLLWSRPGGLHRTRKLTYFQFLDGIALKGWPIILARFDSRPWGQLFWRANAG
jgi:hypothetical protein